MSRSQFPKAKPSKGLPRQPRDWRKRVHVCINSGSYAHDGVPICGECDQRGDNPVHDLRPTSDAAAAIDARKLGEEHGGDQAD
jgi:hypothetical protein